MATSSLCRRSKPFQVGEFSFVLARVGVSTNSIGEELYALILAVAVITMLLTPFVSGLAAPIYAWRKRRFQQEPLQTINLPQTGLHDHIVIAGGGGVGQYVAHVLQRLGLGFVLLELDYRRVEQAKAGLPIILGMRARKWCWKRRKGQRPAAAGRHTSHRDHKKYCDAGASFESRTIHRG